MTSDEKRNLMKLIDSEFEHGNIENLKEIKTYIQAKLSGIHEFDLDDEQKKVLTQTIPEFFRINFPVEERCGLKYSALANAIGRAKRLKSGPVRIYNAFGLDFDKLAAQGFNGNITWIKLESKLNEFGLSVREDLSPRQIELLRKVHKKPSLVVTDKCQATKKIINK